MTLGCSSDHFVENVATYFIFFIQSVGKLDKRVQKGERWFVATIMLISHEKVTWIKSPKLINNYVGTSSLEISQIHKHLPNNKFFRAKQNSKVGWIPGYRARKMIFRICMV